MKANPIGTDTSKGVSPRKALGMMKSPGNFDVDQNVVGPAKSPTKTWRREARA